MSSTGRAVAHSPPTGLHPHAPCASTSNARAPPPPAPALSNAHASPLRFVAAARCSCLRRLYGPSRPVTLLHPISTSSHEPRPPAHHLHPCPGGIGLLEGWAAPETGLGVQQLPPTARVLAGGSVTLSCTFHSRNQSGTGVTWGRGSREAIVLDPAHPFYQGRLVQSQRDQQGQAEATVTLSELMERDSDLYHCYVTHPQGEPEKGPGTTLTVMGRDNREESKQETSTELTIYRATIALAGISIILLVTTLLLRRRTAASADTQGQQPAKGDSRAGGNASEGLHYAEIAFKAPARTEYASIRTQQL